MSPRLSPDEGKIFSTLLQRQQELGATASDKCTCGCSRCWHGQFGCDFSSPEHHCQCTAFVLDPTAQKTSRLRDAAHDVVNRYARGWGFVEGDGKRLFIEALEALKTILKETET